MSFEDNPHDDRYQLDLCIEEIKQLKQQVATLTAERDEAIAAIKAIQFLENANIEAYKEEIGRADKAEKACKELQARNAKLLEACEAAVAAWDGPLLGESYDLAISEAEKKIRSAHTEAIGGE